MFGLERLKGANMDILTTVLSTIAVALIGLVGTVLTTKAGNEKIEHELDKHNAVQDTKLEELTREVRQHNDFATRIPVIEQRVTALEKETFRNK
jgi:Tfp pilus assembly protein PilN